MSGKAQGKVLRDVLYGVSMVSVAGSTDIHIGSLHSDSRQVKQGDVFFAIRGTAADGHRFLPQVVRMGAAAVVCEELPEKLADGVTYVAVRDSREALALVAANYYDHPSRQLKLVGVTGTNGKTTTVTMLHQLFLGLGYKAGLLSTIENRVVRRLVPSTHTTPDPVALNALLAEMVDSGCDYAFMEVSSHAIDQHRVTGLHFSGGVFTNISRDHLDYHKDFKEYIFVKKRFFDMLPPAAFALINTDDKRGRVMVQNTRAAVKTYALNAVADFRVRILESSFDGLVLEIGKTEMYSRMVGRFNAYNILAVLAVGELLGQHTEEVLGVISTLGGAEGRFDYLVSDRQRVVGIVDYAHTPDALKNVLQTVNEVRTGAEQLITLVGCGGDRDKGKRPMMARIASELSDKVILTSDNPRSESPESIINDMKGGVPAHLSAKVLTIMDRREAIRTACSLAAPKDILLLAGKGHEKYQEIGNRRFDFDDKEILKETFTELGK